MKTLLTLLILLLIPSVSFAFTENTSTPTQNNTPIPINTSGTTQVKTGALVSNSYMQADVFYDRYNSGYYMQPRGTNRLNYVVADNILTYGNSITNGEVQGAFFRDRNNGGFYLDPNGVSILNDVRSSIYYDRLNTGYYIQPRGTSRLNYVVFDNTYTYGTGNYADVYLRNAGRWASQVGQISTSIHGVMITPGWQTRDVNAQFCALSDNPSWTFSFYDLDAVHCRAYPIGTNRWRLQAIGHDIDRGDVAACQFACINP